MSSNVGAPYPLDFVRHYDSAIEDAGLVDAAPLGHGHSRRQLLANAAIAAPRVAALPWVGAWWPKAPPLDLPQPQSSSASCLTGAAGFLTLNRLGSARRSLDRLRIILRRTDHAITEVSDQPLRGRICVRLQHPRIVSEMLEHAVFSTTLQQ